jgi:hypothetical protein
MKSLTRRTQRKREKSLVSPGSWLGESTSHLRFEGTVEYPFLPLGDFCVLARNDTRVRDVDFAIDLANTSVVYIQSLTLILHKVS